MSKRSILIGIAIGGMIALVMMVVFFLGILVGNRRENRFFPFWERRPLPREHVPGRLEDHGVIGIIDSLGAKTLVIKDRTGALKTVIVDDQTGIWRGRTPINFSDLKKGEELIILGEPQEQEGAIKARVIRVMGNFGREATQSGALR